MMNFWVKAGFIFSIWSTEMMQELLILMNLLGSRIVVRLFKVSFTKPVEDVERKRVKIAAVTVHDS